MKSSIEGGGAAALTACHLSMGWVGVFYMTSPLTIRRTIRHTFVLASSVVLACMPWVLAAEAMGWYQRPVHILQSLVAVPVAFLSSGLFLCLRSPENPPVWERRAAWAVFILSGAWVSLLVVVWVALSRGMFPGPA